MYALGGMNGWAEKVNGCGGSFICVYIYWIYRNISNRSNFKSRKFINTIHVYVCTIYTTNDTFAYIRNVLFIYVRTVEPVNNGDPFDYSLSI